MVAPLVIAAAGLGALGKIMGGLSARAAARARAKALEQQARQSLMEGGVEAMMGLEADERVIANATVNAAAGGGGLQGSASRVLDDLQRQSVFRARSTIYRAEGEARRARYEGKVAKVEGDNALAGSIVSAGSSLLGAFAKSSLGGGGASASSPKSILAGKSMELKL